MQGQNKLVFNPTIQNILDQKTLQWIFVGGKGGVGKTTVSCSLSLLLSKQRNKVLIISTDPAHNLSDSFNQKLGPSPTQISGIENLFGCEIDPKMNDDTSGNIDNVLGFSADTHTMKLMNELMTSIPGIDEAMCLGYILKIVKDLDFDCVVFDTAPTGHTLRLLNFPHLLEKGLEKMLTLKDKIGNFIQSVGILGGNSWEQTFEKLFYSMDNLKENVEIINSQFKNHVYCLI